MQQLVDSLAAHPECDADIAIRQADALRRCAASVFASADSWRSRRDSASYLATGSKVRSGPMASAAFRTISDPLSKRWSGERVPRWMTRAPSTSCVSR